MSISNWSDTNYLNKNFGSTPNQFTMMGWFYFASFPTDGVLLQLETTGSGAGVDLEILTAGTINVWPGSGSAVNSGFTLALNRWYHIAMAVTAVNGGTMTPYLDGVAGTGATTALAGSGGTYRIGRDIATGEALPATTRISNLKIWHNGSAILSAADVKRERTAASFLTQRSLYSWMPCFHGGYAGRDLSGKGNHFTINGAFTTAQEPPAIVRPRRFRVPFGKVAAAGGGAAAAQNLLPLIGVG